MEFPTCKLCQLTETSQAIEKRGRNFENKSNPVTGWHNFDNNNLWLHDNWKYYN